MAETLLLTRASNFPRRQFVQIGQGEAGNLIRERDAQPAGEPARNGVAEGIHFQPGKKGVNGIYRREQQKRARERGQQRGALSARRQKVADFPHNAADEAGRKHIAGDDDQSHGHHARQLKADF